MIFSLRHGWGHPLLSCPPLSHKSTCSQGLCLSATHPGFRWHRRPLHIAVSCDSFGVLKMLLCLGICPQQGRSCEAHVLICLPVGIDHTARGRTCPTGLQEAGPFCRGRGPHCREQGCEEAPRRLVAPSDRRGDWFEWSRRWNFSEGAGLKLSGPLLSPPFPTPRCQVLLSTCSARSN